MEKDFLTAMAEFKRDFDLEENEKISLNKFSKYLKDKHIKIDMDSFLKIMENL